MTRKNRNKSLDQPIATTKGALARTRRAERPAQVPRFTNGALRRINNRLSWPADDSTTLHIRAARSGSSATSTGSLVIALDPTNIATTGYTSLGAISPIVLAMSDAYSRFIVTHVIVKTTLTTPITNGGYCGLGFTPDNSYVSGQPANISDATSAVHSDMAQVGDSAMITFDASNYFVDWRPTRSSGATAADNQCGVVQMYFDGGSTGTTSQLYEVDFVIHFAGFRKIG